jgi:hypothetical protein
LYKTIICNTLTNAPAIDKKIQLDHCPVMFHHFHFTSLYLWYYQTSFEDNNNNNSNNRELRRAKSGCLKLQCLFVSLRLISIFWFNLILFLICERAYIWNILFSSLVIWIWQRIVFPLRLLWIPEKRNIFGKRKEKIELTVRRQM